MKASLAGGVNFQSLIFVVVFERFKDLENFRFDMKLLTKLRRI